LIWPALWVILIVLPVFLYLAGLAAHPIELFRRALATPGEAARLGGVLARTAGAALAAATLSVAFGLAAFAAAMPLGRARAWAW
jgi:ABC-type Fe3+ transport system permease subunit